MTPYTTRSGVRIGSAYIPPAQRMSRDAVRLQSVLLSERYGTPRMDRADRIVVAGSTIAAISFAVIVLLS